MHPSREIASDHDPRRVRTKSAESAAAATASSGSKSLMKTSGLASRGELLRRPATVPTSMPAAKARRKPLAPTGTGSRTQKIEERIAAASEELASGITEAASAAEELQACDGANCQRSRGGGVSRTSIRSQSPAPRLATLVLGSRASRPIAPPHRSTAELVVETRTRSCLGK